MGYKSRGCFPVGIEFDAEGKRVFEICPFIKEKCHACGLYRRELYCGVGEKIDRGKTSYWESRISKMSKCPDIIINNKV